MIDIKLDLNKCLDVTDDNHRTFTEDEYLWFIIESLT